MFNLKQLIVLIALCQQTIALAEQAPNVNTGVQSAISKTINKAVNEVMDGFHDAADKGDKTRYLAYFAQDGVFMGTDDWERWSLSEFKGYVNKRFKDGKGWSYKPLDRHIGFNAKHDTAWIDEITFSEKWGRFRGTGVLVKENEQWKIAHYSMSMLVPNDAWEEISKIATQTYEKVNKSKTKAK